MILKGKYYLIFYVIFIKYNVNKLYRNLRLLDEAFKKLKINKIIPIDKLR
jgi:hypothetical protein